MSNEKTKHTPGPWVVKRRGAAFSSHEVRSKVEKSLIPIAYVTKLNDCEANLSLIKAAPDLLRDLTDLLDRVDRLCDAAPEDGDEALTFPEANRAAMRANLAKARGGK